MFTMKVHGKAAYGDVIDKKLDKKSMLKSSRKLPDIGYSAKIDVGGNQEVL